LAFNNNYQYVGLQAGGQCWGSNDKIGKYGSSDKCNYKCPDGMDICGGKGVNTIYRLAYGKDKLCSIKQKFDELDKNGVIQYGNGGELTNPNGDGELFLWTPRVEGDPFYLSAVRTKDGEVKGFKTFSDNPFYSSGLKFLTWDASTGKLEGLGFTYKTVNDYSVE
jgi:hypothetical protein